MKNLKTFLSVAMVGLLSSVAVTAETATRQVQPLDLDPKLTLRILQGQTLGTAEGTAAELLTSSKQREEIDRLLEPLADALSLSYEELGDLAQKIRLHQERLRPLQESDQHPADSADPRADR